MAFSYYDYDADKDDGTNGYVVHCDRANPNTRNVYKATYIDGEMYGKNGKGSSVLKESTYIGTVENWAKKNIK